MSDEKQVPVWYRTKDKTPESGQKVYYLSTMGNEIEAVFKIIGGHAEGLFQQWVEPNTGNPFFATPQFWRPRD
jgi:hypothetical protein